MEFYTNSLRGFEGGLQWKSHRSYGSNLGGKVKPAKEE